jgi:hypothetical protein
MTLAEANHVLRLSDSQLAIVRQAAVPLSPSARVRYLKTVAAELAEAERVDDRQSRGRDRALHAGRPMKQEAAVAHRYDDDFDLGYDLFNGCVD